MSAGMCIALKIKIPGIAPEKKKVSRSPLVFPSSNLDLFLIKFFEGVFVDNDLFIPNILQNN